MLTMNFPYEFRIWDLQGNEVFEVPVEGTSWEARFSPDGSLLAVGLGNGTIQLLDSLPAEETDPLEREVDREPLPNAVLLRPGTERLRAN